MKNTKSLPFKKLRSKLNPSEVYYDVSQGVSKDIDGVEFIYVVKNIGIKDIPKLMRKDSLEYVK